MRVTLLLVALVGTTTVPVRAAEVGYFDVNGSQEAILSEMALHPAAVHANGHTYLAYQGPGFDPYIAVYRHADDTWLGPWRAGRNPLRIDAHGAPSLHIDDEGYLHLYYGSHGGSLRHSKSADPWQADSWIRQADVTAHATYPQTVEMPDGRIALFYRGASPPGDWNVRMSTDDGRTFMDEGVILDAHTDTGWYLDIRAGASGRVHLAFVRLDYDAVRAGTLFGARRDLYYAYRETDGTWRGADGVALTLPIDETVADAHCKVWDSGSDLVNEVTVKEDASGAACLLFLRGSGAGPGAYDWRFMRQDGGGWDASTIVTTDHCFDAGALDPQADGSFEAFLVTGDSDAVGAPDGDYRGRGGRIVRFSSADGASWTREGRVSPAEGPGVIFSDPVLIKDGLDEARVLFSDWTQQENDFHRRMFLWGDAGLVTRDTDPRLTRLAGRDRIETCVAISHRAFPEGARWVVVATSQDFPDALAGAPLAHALWAPLLLTSPTRLSSAVAAEVDRLGATNAIVLGGTAAVSEQVVRDLKAQTGVTNVERVSGSNRYHTAVAIAERMRDPHDDVHTAVVVDGRNWPDAVVAAPLAAAHGWPIIPVEGNRLGDETRLTLDRYGIDHTIIIGGTDVVTRWQEDHLPDPTRLAGSDRYSTAAKVAEWSMSHGLLPGRVLVASGWAFPDALSGGMLGARVRGPVLLTPIDTLVPPASGYLEAHAGDLVDVFVLGEPDVVSTGVAEAVMAVLE